VFSYSLCSVPSYCGYIAAAGIVVSISVCRLFWLNICLIENIFHVNTADLYQICAQYKGAICYIPGFQESVVLFNVQALLNLRNFGVPQLIQFQGSSTYAVSGFLNLRNFRVCNFRKKYF